MHEEFRHAHDVAPFLLIPFYFIILGHFSVGCPEELLHFKRLQQSGNRLRCGRDVQTLEAPLSAFASNSVISGGFYI